MKDLGWKAVLVLALSMAAWWALDVAFPSAPPDGADTMVIVGFMLGVVLSTSAVLKRVRKRGASAGVGGGDAADAAEAKEEPEGGTGVVAAVSGVVDAVGEAVGDAMEKLT